MAVLCCAGDVVRRAAAAAGVGAPDHFLICSLMHTLALPDAHGGAAQETSYGVLRPPLGSVRLTIIELVAVLLRAGSEAAEGAIMASSAVQEVLQVFLRFPFNSILHHQASS